MPWPQSEGPCLHLGRARDREGGSKSAWCPELAGGVPAQELVVEGVKGGKSAPSQRKYTKKRQKRRSLLNSTLKDILARFF